MILSGYLTMLDATKSLQVYPGVRSAGKYILIEIDRSVANDDDEEADEEVKDLALYSLQVLGLWFILQC